MAARNASEDAFIDQEPRTRTTSEQAEVAKTVTELYEEFDETFAADGGSAAEGVELKRSQHLSYLLKGLKGLSSGYACLDASRPWLVYWIVHAIDLLGGMHLLQEPSPSDLVKFLAKCQHKDGGFAGGPLQDPHIAPTYAAISAVAAIGTEEAYEMVDRRGLLNFLLRMRADEECYGAFYMHLGGEIDIRGTYCGLSAARLLNVITPELTKGCDDFLLRCQTYEGGFGCVPFAEAHSGYTFCGLAACHIVGCQDRVNTPKLLNWLTARQMTKELGFNGRTNKVVDSCYSWWQGGAFPLISMVLNKEMHDEGIQEVAPGGSWLFDQMGLQQYVLIAGQSEYGGLRDKPKKGSDYYHTCYALSGLSGAQHSNASVPTVYGSEENLLRPTDSIHNVCSDKVEKMLQYFSTRPLSEDDF